MTELLIEIYQMVHANDIIMEIHINDKYLYNDVRIALKKNRHGRMFSYEIDVLKEADFDIIKEEISSAIEELKEKR